MATIEIERGRFIVAFDALGSKGRDTHYRSIYTPKGRRVVERQLDRRSVFNRYKRHLLHGRRRERIRFHEGIFQSKRLGDGLVFLDQLRRENELFIRWRGQRDEDYSK